jgi:DNA polymerase-3 subunit gamma/tau
MERFIVSARKYRPASFGDVVGQPAIAATLKNSIRNGHLGHAYLFSGPRGVGKTTCARIFAKTINCADITPEGEACNQCESCLSFMENRSYSIHELDAASNNSVDDIRTLTEKVRIPPQIGAYSIYIIDEVHMLSQSAFNAFLKTLEEPPSHAIFILATTEKHKIIPTILSRCQIFDFNRISVEDAAGYMKKIAENEGIDYEEDALHVIAQKADGAMRDALSIFDQVVAFSGAKLAYQDVIRNLNILDYDYYFRLTAYAMEGDASAMLLLFNEVLAKGFDARNFINGYAAHLRDLMVCKDPQTVQLMDVGEGIREKYLSQAREVGLTYLYEGLEICNQADIQFRSSRNQRLTIELALVKLSRLNASQKKKSLAEKPRKDPGSADVSGERPSTVEEPVPEERERTQPEAGDKGTGRVVRRPAISIRESLDGSGSEKEEPAEKGKQDPDADSTDDVPPEVDPDVILSAWEEYAGSLQKTRPRVYSTLRSKQPVVLADGSIRVVLDSEAQRDNFLKNIRPGLARYICDSAGMAALEIHAEIMETEQNGKKIYTDQDKLAYLIKKNPGLGKLKTKFNLDFDD